jgi:hypothetical protein
LKKYLICVEMSAAEKARENASEYHKVGRASVFSINLVEQVLKQISTASKSGNYILTLKLEAEDGFGMMFDTPQSLIITPFSWLDESRSANSWTRCEILQSAAYLKRILTKPENGFKVEICDSDEKCIIVTIDWN